MQVDEQPGSLWFELREADDRVVGTAAGLVGGLTALVSVTGLGMGFGAPAAAAAAVGSLGLYAAVYAWLADQTVTYEITHTHLVLRRRSAGTLAAHLFDLLTVSAGGPRLEEHDRIELSRIRDIDFPRVAGTDYVQLWLCDPCTELWIPVGEGSDGSLLRMRERILANADFVGQCEHRRVFVLENFRKAS